MIPPHVPLRRVSYRGAYVWVRVRVRVWVRVWVRAVATAEMGTTEMITTHGCWRS